MVREIAKQVTRRVQKNLSRHLVDNCDLYVMEQFIPSKEVVAFMDYNGAVFVWYRKGATVPRYVHQPDPLPPPEGDAPAEGV